VIGWLRKRRQRKAEAHVPHFDRGDPAPCTCSCHKTPGMVHVVPCCWPCEKCGVAFARGRRAHRATCEGT
jgi:hypothetical protein